VFLTLTGHAAELDGEGATGSGKGKAKSRTKQVEKQVEEVR